MNDPIPIRRTIVRSGAPVLLGLLAACGGTSGGSAFDSDDPGTTASKSSGAGAPQYDGTEFYVVDESEGGQAQVLEFVDAYWGRLVDIYDSQSRLIFADYVVGPEVGLDQEAVEPGWDPLFTNGVTGDQSLTLKADFELERESFDTFLADAASSVVDIQPKSLKPSELPPFPLVARNAAVVLSFSDLLDETSIGAQQSVKVLTGTPPVDPFDARIFGDPNHGGVDGSGNFHPTRVIVDFTISETELASIPQVVEVNGVGLPPSVAPGTPNVALRLATREAPELGDFKVLRNLKGKSIDPFSSLQGDFTSPTLDIVQALRSGSPVDPNGGFLVDNVAPTVVGIQAVTVTSVTPVVGSDRDYLLGYDFVDGACAVDAVLGDVLQFGEFRLEVTAPVAAVGVSLTDVPVTVPVEFDLAQLGDLGLLAGQTSQLFTPWRAGLDASLAPCFVRFTPAATGGSAAGVDPEAKLLVRFSEPIRPESVRPFDTFFIGRVSGLDTTTTTPPKDDPDVPRLNELVLGRVLPSPDSRNFRFAPALPFTHEAGSTESYFFNIVSAFGEGLTDLAGNTLAVEFPEVQFTIDSAAFSQDTGGWLMRFSATDEDSVDGVDLAGQYIFDETQGRIVPRSVQRFGLVVDRQKPLVAPMTPFAAGTPPAPNISNIEPLVSAGSRMQHVWRYMDVGLEVTQVDGEFYNLDIEGVALSPITGQVTSAIYDEFEMAVGHGKNLYDELFDPVTQTPIFPTSGFGGTDSFEENYFVDGSTVVSPRENGFALSSADLFLAPGNVALARMPWNLGVPEGEKVYWTWRDTSIQDRGALNENSELLAAGAPTFQEWTFAPLSQIFGPDVARVPGDVYSFAVSGAGDGAVLPGVPTGGLPILLEYRCFPTEQASLNLFDGSYHVPAGLAPFSRAYSSGGNNLSGSLIQKDPDLELSPSGGFVPQPPSTNPPTQPPVPPGTPTAPRDPVVYLGQLDVVLRVSRVFTVIIDSENNPGSFIGGVVPGATTTTYEPDYTEVIVEPLPAEQPSGTSVTFAWRGTDRARVDPPVDDILVGSNLDLYGDVAPGPVSTVDDMGFLVPNDPVDPELFSFTNSESGFSTFADQLDAVDGLRFVQTRITFVSNATTLEQPSLSAYGLVFRR